MTQWLKSWNDNHGTISRVGWNLSTEEIGFFAVLIGLSTNSFQRLADQRREQEIAVTSFKTRHGSSMNFKTGRAHTWS